MNACSATGGHGRLVVSIDSARRVIKAGSTVFRLVTIRVISWQVGAASLGASV